MKIPLSWVNDFVEIRDLPLNLLANRLTLAGLNVEEITLVGLSVPEGQHIDFKLSGIAWQPDKIVTAAVHEVMPHPNADRLVLCRLDDGEREHIVLTGAPNLYPYKGIGVLEQPLKVAYAKEGAQIYDGHEPGQVLTTLKRAKIRGVDSYSMICSEKELGISDEHDGVIILDSDAPVGVPLAEYMGDAVFEIEITPNIARNASVYGVAREISALFDRPLHPPKFDILMDGQPIEGQAFVEIHDSALNPRFVVGLIRDAVIAPSPYWVQRRLRLAGMRPISNVVDATNYIMLELGQPLHAFDYDVLVQRAGGKAPTIITRTAAPGERLTTLDGVEHALNDFNVLVTDTAGALSIAGVMGGAESEISASTRNILLEGAAWNFINIRRTMMAQKMSTEASYRFSRGVHPAMCDRGVLRCLDLMRAWSGGVVSRGLVDNYPLPPDDPTLSITPADVRRWIGIDLSPVEIAGILRRLEFGVQIHGETIRAKTPDHRLDINTGILGVADLMEEIARVYGYDRIPETTTFAELSPYLGNPRFEREELLRDLLVGAGVQEVVTHRMTAPEREARSVLGEPRSKDSYLWLANPISSDRIVLRTSLLASVLEVTERNIRLSDSLAFFEIGPVFLPVTGQELPNEPSWLAIALTGLRRQPDWDRKGAFNSDFYDLKGILETLLTGLHLHDVKFEPAEHPAYHPGKCARLLVNGLEIGVFGELHPLVKERYDFGAAPVVAGEFDLGLLLPQITERFETSAVPPFPPVKEDIAVVLDENIPAARVAEVIRQAGGKLLVDVRLFDIFRGGQIGAGKKSMAYSLTYQSTERTLTDADAAQIRQRVVRRLEQELQAKLRA